jgi:hypothetical protein
MFQIMTILQTTFEQALFTEKISKKEWAHDNDIHPSEISRFMKTGKLSEAMESCIFTGWRNPAVRITLLESHFQDQILKYEADDLISSVTIDLK